MAAPIPRAAPVMSAVLPAKRTMLPPVIAKLARGMVLQEPGRSESPGGAGLLAARHARGAPARAAPSGDVGLQGGDQCAGALLVLRREGHAVEVRLYHSDRLELVIGERPRAYRPLGADVR